jgi:hypothetical protein
MKHIKTYKKFNESSAELDRILDKISRRGMESLSEYEVAYLDKLSGKKTEPTPKKEVPVEKPVIKPTVQPISEPKKSKKDFTTVDNYHSLSAVYTQPTKLYIVGDCFPSGEANLSVDDDYSFVRIVIGDKTYQDIFDCTGFISIMRQKEFDDYVSFITEEREEFSLEDIGMDVCVLEDFVGEIEVGALGIGEFDINDFIQHQSDEQVFVVLRLPEGTKIRKFDESIDLK